MGFIGDFIGDVVGGITGAKQSAKGQQQAAQTMATAADKALAEQRSARDASAALQQPYVDAGSKAIAQQMSLIGLNGTASQQDGISALLSSPEYSTTVRQGEEAILQNASATGGLRGGNTNNSLANFRADALANLINNQYQRLGGLTSIGQNAAAGVGNNGMAGANAISQLLGQQASALAGGQIAKGNQVANNFQSMIDLAGAVAGFGGFSGGLKTPTVPKGF